MKESAVPEKSLSLRAETHTERIVRVNQSLQIDKAITQ